GRSSTGWIAPACLAHSFNHLVGSAARAISRKETLWNVRLHQSALAPENLITLAHFSVSVVMNLAKSEDEPGNTVAPRSANRAFNLGSTRPALISLLSLSTISADVSLGAPMPCNALASYPGTKSPTVGTSGNTSERVAVVTASGRSLPALMNSVDSGTGLNTTCTCPAMRSVIAGAPPR